LKDIREKMLAGKNFAACSNCCKQEAAGIQSERLQWIEKFPNIKLETLTTSAILAEVEQLDLAPKFTLKFPNGPNVCGEFICNYHR
jgi:hypothetical protein